MKENNKDIAARVREMRQICEFSTQQMADSLSIPLSDYEGYESGGHDIPTEVLVRIADFYQVSVDYLLNRTDKREMNR